MEKRRRIGNVSAWAYAFECAVGWGAFVMPTNIFLPEAGPIGAFIGICLATLAIILIGLSISYLAKEYPDCEGVHEYIGKVLGADHGFLSAWAILLAYLSVMWANATAVILLIRALFGDILQFGFYYQVAGYDVYFGEILATALILMLFGLLAVVGKLFIRMAHVGLAFLHIALLVAVFVGILMMGNPSQMIDSGFANVDIPKGMQVFNIVMLGPWMFVGFESVTYMMNSGGRRVDHIKSVIVIAAITGLFAYLLPALIPVFSLPNGYSDWTIYLQDAKAADGLMALPVFYSVKVALGNFGLAFLVASILCAIFTSLFGLYRATARLLVKMSEEELLPKVVGKKNEHGEPTTAIWIIMAISLIVPFFGRTAIGWIVDVTTISATIVYVYSSVGCLKLSSLRHSDNLKVRFVSVSAMVVAAVSFLFLMIPNIFSENKLATESYFVLAAWSIVGLILYFLVLRKDEKGMYGSSTAMWMLMLFLIFFSSIMWIRQRTAERLASLYNAKESSYLGFLTTNVVIQMLFVFVALVIMFSMFSIMRKRENESMKKALESESRNKAKTAFLFNMSHDIRTPMNAILGFTDLALIDPGDKEKTEDYLKKIKSSGAHLLSLINDVLEMSRIESGKIELNSQPSDLREIFHNLDSIIRGQAQAKEQSLVVEVKNVNHPFVYVDRLRMNQVLLNLASNAVKYTEEKGEINIWITEIQSDKEGYGTYHIHVKDNGMGMSKEFADKIFEAFERDKKAEAKGIQGTGLGMAITKRIIDVVGGEIELITAPNKGSEFIVKVDLRFAAEDEVRSVLETSDTSEVGFAGKRVLLADDIDVNREIGVAILEMLELVVEEAEDGQDAVEKVLSHPAGYYDAVLMDIQMPRLDGYEATKKIREVSDEKKANIPIIAMTANAFEEDINNAKASGMNGHVAKPIDIEQLTEEMHRVFGKFEG